MLRFWLRFDYIKTKLSFYLTHEMVRLTLRILHESSYRENHREFPGGPGVKTSNAGSAGLIPGQEAKISFASRPKNQSMKQKKYRNKLNRLKVVHIKKKKKERKKTMITKNDIVYLHYCPLHQKN